MTGASKRERILVAMSGGVDSSVAVALLVEAGYEVIGATMRFMPSWLPGNEAEDGCCALAAVEDARRVAETLRIPHYVLNLTEAFETEVMTPFVQGYLGGTTPNPCLICNTRIKFGALLERARALGASRIATGHYARVEFDAGRGRRLLRRGLDPAKDQSYVLYGLSQEQLAASLFPLGAMDKNRVRRMAVERGLPVAGKRESQEICFIPDNDYPAFIQAFAAGPRSAGCAKSRATDEEPRACPVRDPAVLKPGPIVDQQGRVLGRHSGVARYTVGQRRGLGLAAAEPLYVLELRVERNEIVAGPEEALYRRDLMAGELNWIAFAEPPARLDVQAKIRYAAAAAAAEVFPQKGSRALVRFVEPQRAIAPGQAVVFYRGDEVLGGGTIIRPERIGMPLP